MGCCTSFSATTSTARLQPSRHINFTTGMVLGVDDYRQQFAYHAGRDQWMVRALNGYGTLSGLEVSLEDDGEAGPRVRVSPGTAAAPSGQMICVGREQCGALNQWLQRPEVTTQVDALAAAAPPSDSARFPVWLTLCYRDCAVAPVPVPGEPCRSDEELMAPSRIADDYTLSFALSPPPMAETEGIVRLSAWLATVAVNNGGESDPAQLFALLAAAEQQLDALFPPVDVAPPVPASLDPIDIHPDLAPRLFDQVKRLWITRLRPRVIALGCGQAGEQGDDCIMLARLDLGVIRAPAGWQVANIVDGDGAVDARLDQSGRPLLLAGNIAQTQAGTLFAGAASPGAVDFVGADGSTAVSDGFVVIVGDDPVALTIPRPDAATQGDRVSIRITRASGSTIAAAGGGTIGGEDELDMDGLSEVQLQSDGAGDWIALRRIERGG